jgi:hypothetical protein
MLFVVQDANSKSSVSKMRTAFGQFSATRQPNCSSIIKRSNDSLKAEAVLQTSKLELFKAIVLSDLMPNLNHIKSLSCAEKQMWIVKSLTF